MTKQEWERAKQSGIYARQAGKRRDACPLFAMGNEGELLREAWRMGWDEEDARRQG